MAIFAAPLSSRLHVEVRIRASTRRGQRGLPGGQNDVVGAALIDTGSEVSMIHQAAADKLGLQSNYTEPIGGITGDVEYRKVYAVDFYLVGNGPTPRACELARGASAFEDILDRPSVEVCGRPLEPLALIGMDILRHCQFYIDGLDQRFVLTAPTPITSA